VIDRSIMDVFLDQGARSATSIFFSKGALDTLELATDSLADEVTIETDVWGLTSTWP
jgi:beta-fructofuranosidase